MYKGDLDTIRQIEETIPHLQANPEGIVELVYLVKKAIEITKLHEPDNISRIKMMNALVNNELAILLDTESDPSTLEYRFDEAVNAFKLDLKYGKKF